MACKNELESIQNLAIADGIQNRYYITSKAVENSDRFLPCIIFHYQPLHVSNNSKYVSMKMQYIMSKSNGEIFVGRLS